jgi:simple sugar transport system permease protein
MDGFLAKLRHRPEAGSFLGFIVIFIMFSIFGDQFFTLGNQTSLFTLTAELGIICIGVGFLMISGEFDLSVGSVYALGGIVFMMLTPHMHSLLALAIVLLIAASIGWFNGYITTKHLIPSFLVTLSMMLIIRGLIYMITAGKITTHKGDLVVRTLFSEKMSGLPEILSDFRPSHLWFIGLLIIFHYILFNTRYGNHVFATGVNKPAAVRMGLNTDWIKTKNFMICSCFAALSGVIAVSRFRMGSPTIGLGMELEVIAAAVIGGVSLYGGTGAIIGIFFSAYLICMIRNGLLLMGAPPYWYSGFVGVIVLISTILNIKLQPRKSKY